VQTVLHAEPGDGGGRSLTCADKHSKFMLARFELIKPGLLQTPDGFSGISRRQRLLKS
jgi:hypothetical protein